jgi:hypothetical protein
VQLNYRTLFRLLEPRHIITVYNALLCEVPILSVCILFCGVIFFGVSRCPHYLLFLFDYDLPADALLLLLLHLVLCVPGCCRSR